MLMNRIAVDAVAEEELSKGAIINYFITTKRLAIM